MPTPSANFTHFQSSRAAQWAEHHLAKCEALIVRQPEAQAQLEIVAQPIGQDADPAVIELNQHLADAVNFAIHNDRCSQHDLLEYTKGLRLYMSENPLLFPYFERYDIYS